MDTKQDVAQKFGFVEYSSSLLVHADLYKHPTYSKEEVKGEPIYSKELYKFNDRKGRNIAIRPDTTPQFMHMLKRVRGNEYPSVSQWLWPRNIMKWFTIADCWRYERPGLGRRRNHVQCSLDIVGIEGIEAEIEILKVLIYMLQEFGMTSVDVVIRLNHRRLIDKVLEHVGVMGKMDACKKVALLRLIDKRRRIGSGEFMLKLQKLLGEDAAQKYKTLVDACTSINTARQVFGSDEDINALEMIINTIGPEWCELDLSLVRGNDYYTGIIFEVYQRDAPSSRAIAGGGRYDGFFGKTGIKQLDHSVGFGMGNIQLARLIKPDSSVQQSPSIDVVVMLDTTADRWNEKLDIVLQQLRHAGNKVYKVLDGWKMPRVMQFATQSHAKLLIRPDHQNKDSLLVAEPPDWTPKSVAYSQLLQF